MYPMMLGPYENGSFPTMFVEKTSDEIGHAAAVRAPEVRASAEGRLAFIRDVLSRGRDGTAVTAEKLLEVVARNGHGVRTAVILGGQQLAEDVKRAFAEARQIITERALAERLDFVAKHVRGATVQRLPIDGAMVLFETYKAPSAELDDNEIIGAAPLAQAPRSLADVVSSLGG